MKKFLSAVLALTFVFVAFAFSSCGKQVDGTKLVIGATGPLTGDYATYGTSVKQGAELAVKEINANGGVNGMTLEFHMEDDQADPQLAVNAYAALMDKGMQVSLGSTTSGACISFADEANRDNIFMLTPSGSAVECTKYEAGFRICFTDPDQGIYAADFIANNNITKKVAIIYDSSNEYSKGIHNNFVSQSEKVGIEIVSDNAFTKSTSTDFTTSINNIKASGAELVFLPIYAQEAASVLTQAKKAGLSAIFFGCDGLDGVISKIGAENVSATEGVMLLTPFAADSSEPKTVAFVEAYAAEFNGAVPDQFAADAYDAVYTIVAAVKYAGVQSSTDAELTSKLVSAMTKITVDGVTGSMVWSAEGEPAKSATAVVISGGKYVAYDIYKNK